MTRPGLPDPRRLPTRLLAAFVAGLPMPLAFAPFGLYPLAVVLPALLLVLAAGEPPRRAAALGYAFGLGWFCTGIYWITISLHTYGSAPLAFAVLCTAVVVALMALYPAVLTGLLARLRAPEAVRWLLLAPALWGLLEWVRSWLFTGFPWLALGYASLDAPLAGFAPLTGVFGLSALMMLTSGALACALRRRWWPALVAAAVWAGGWGAAQVQWTVPDGDPFTVSLVQANISQDLKFREDQLQRQLRLYLAMSLTEAEGSDVIIWPETAIPAFYEDMQPFLDVLREEALESGSDYITGIAAGSWQSGVFHNAIASIGSHEGLYHKRRLLPFGEYLPLRGLLSFFRHLVEIPMADFTPGASEQPPLMAGGVAAGPSICFEAVFGSEIRRALPEARYLVNLSNDAWFGRSLAPHQHLQIARMRALETGREMARATNTGISAVIDHRGAIRAHSDLFTSEVVTAHVIPRAGLTPYARLGDVPVILALGLIAVVGGAVARRLAA